MGQQDGRVIGGLGAAGIAAFGVSTGFAAQEDRNL
jgi:hypothetical protein